MFVCNTKQVIIVATRKNTDNRRRQGNVSLPLRTIDRDNDQLTCTTQAAFLVESNRQIERCTSWRVRRALAEPVKPFCDNRILQTGTEGHGLL